MFGKHIVPMNHIIEIGEELEKLKADTKYVIGVNEMRDHLGGHFHDYSREIDGLEQIIPKDCLSDFGRKYVEKTEHFLKRITQAINLSHIVPDARGTAKQKERLVALQDEASDLHDQYTSNFVPDASDMSQTGQPYLSDAQYLWDYSGLEETHSRPYDRAYSALEGYPVYIALRKEDFQANDVINRNAVQQHWLERVLADNASEDEAPKPQKSFLADIINQRHASGDF
ncbi:hypothetical protein FHR76_002199 [Rhizobium sp. RAS22]|nr:hypothetical protein [Rhizobium sp. RAS22]